MRDKFTTVLLVFLAFSLGWVVAPRSAGAWSPSIGDSAHRIAETLERIEKRLERCQR